MLNTYIIRGTLNRTEKCEQFFKNMHWIERRLQFEIEVKAESLPSAIDCVQNIIKENGTVYEIGYGNRTCTHSIKFNIEDIKSFFGSV